MWAEREASCTDCGNTVRGRFSPSKPVRCLDCNITRAINAAMEMANHSGPAYDKWLETNGPKGRPKKVPATGGLDEAR